MVSLGIFASISPASTLSPLSTTRIAPAGSKYLAGEPEGSFAVFPSESFIVTLGL